MEAKQKQALMARYHHLNDHIKDLDKERDEAAKELAELSVLLFEQPTITP